MVADAPSGGKAPVCVVLGGGGHASVVIDTIKASGMDLDLAVLDPDRAKWGEKVAGVPVLGGDEMLSELVSRGATHFAVGLGSTGDNAPRKRLYELGHSLGLKPVRVIHPSAVCSSLAKVGPGTVLMPGSIANAGAVIGANVIINSGAIVEHDCVIGDHVHVATGALLASTVRVGSCAHIGIGATIRQGLLVGERAVVGAGAVVVKDVPSDTVVAGVPASLLRHWGQRRI